MPRFRGEERHKVSEVSGWVAPVTNLSGEPYGWEGVVMTPLGYVQVYCTFYADGRELWSFRVIAGGYQHSHREERAPSERLTERGAKTLAHRWIKTVYRRMERRTKERERERVGTHERPDPEPGGLRR